jgi:hypothetical protein
MQSCAADTSGVSRIPGLVQRLIESTPLSAIQFLLGADGNKSQIGPPLPHFPSTKRR